MPKILIIAFIFFGIFHTEQGFAQVIRYKTGNEPLCISFKERGVHYLLDEGTIEYKGKTIAKTERGCFFPPPTLCNSNKIIDIQFKPYNIYKYFKMTIPLQLKGIKRTRVKSPNLRCVPTGKNSYSGDPIRIKISNYYRKLNEAIPYVKNVRVKDSALYKKIVPYVKDCDKNDKTCIIYKAYKQVTSTLKYKQDPSNIKEDLIRSPQETIKNGGGDCEDLTGVLVSYLVNLGIKSYVVMTDDHAYSMACGINKTQLEEFIKEGFNTEETEIEKFTLAKGQSKIFSYRKPNTGKDNVFRWTVKTQSKYPFDLYVVNSKINITQRNIDRLPINQKCSQKNITYFSIPCALTAQDQIVLRYGDQVIKGNQKKNITLEITIKDNYLDSVKDFSIHYYLIKKLGNDKYCVVLEATAGQYGYPGYADRKNKGTPIAIDPKSWDWFFIN